MPTNLLVKNLLSCAQNNDKTISFTTMMKTEVSDSDCHAYQTTLGRAASYYDLNLSLETGEFNRRLKLFDIEQATNTTACVPLQPNVMERKLWPALVYASWNDLRSQLGGDGGSPTKARLHLLAQKAVLKKGLLLSNAAFVHMLGVQDESSIVAIKAEFATCLGDEASCSTQEQSILFDFEHHKIQMGKALVHSDHQLIVAFQIAWARIDGVYASLKRNKDEFHNILREAVLSESIYKRACIDAFNTDKGTVPNGDVHMHNFGGSDEQEGRRPNERQAQGLPSNNVDGSATALGGVSPDTSSNSSVSSSLSATPISIEYRAVASPMSIESRFSDAPDTAARSSSSQAMPRSPPSPIAPSRLESRYSPTASNAADRIRILDKNSDEDTAIIHSLMHATPRLSYGLLFTGCSIHNESLLTLLPLEWVNDEIINAFLLKVLKPRLPHTAGVWILNSYFMSTLLQTGTNGRATPSYCFARVKRWDKLIRIKGKILGKSLIFVPINHQNVHWLFLWANTDTYTIALVDPQGRKPQNMLYLNAMRDYLDQKRSDYNNVDGWKDPHPDKEWELLDLSESFPRQYNDCDCGIFTLVNITLLAQGLHVDSETYSEQSLDRSATRERVGFLLWDISRNRPTVIPDAAAPTRRHFGPRTRRSSSAQSAQEPIPPTSSSLDSSQAIYIIPPSSNDDTSTISSAHDTATDHTKTSTLQQWFTHPLPNHCVCQVCQGIATTATEMGCCGAICCGTCVPPYQHACTMCGKVRLSGDRYRGDIVTELIRMWIYCPLQCGWVGELKDYEYHDQFCCQGQFKNTKMQSIEELVQNFNTTDIQRRVEQIVLDHPLVFKHKCCPAQLKKDGVALRALAGAMVSHQYVSILPDLNLRGSILYRAIGILMRVLRRHERHVNSISGKNFGGGVHQTLTYGCWCNFSEWVMVYLIATFGDLSTYRCCDIGCGLNFPSLVACIVDSRLSFIGLEVDPNRIILAAEIAIEVLPDLNELLGRHPRVGLMYADASDYLNLSASHLILLWDRALPTVVVIMTYDSIWRSYRHPFLLVQSLCW